MKSNSWRQFKAILRKDIVMELRTKEMISSMGLYAILTMVVYQIALAEAGETFDVRLVMPGLIWVAFIFMSMLGLNRSFVHEKDQGCIEALLLSPVDRPVIFFAKAIGNLIFLLIVKSSRFRSSHSCSCRDEKASGTRSGCWQWCSSGLQSASPASARCSPR